MTALKILTPDEIVETVDGRRGGNYVSVLETEGFESITPATLEYKDDARKWASKAKKANMKHPNKPWILFTSEKGPCIYKNVRFKNKEEGERYLDGMAREWKSVGAEFVQDPRDFYSIEYDPAGELDE